MRYSNIFILGASGFVGSAVVRRLKADGYRLGALVKHNEDVSELHDLGVETFRGDINDQPGLENILSTFEADAIVHLVGIVKEQPPESTFQKIHVEGTKSVIAAAKTCEVEKIIYISALGAKLDGDTEYYRSKAQAEEIIKASGIAYTILRPSLMFGQGAGFTNQLLDQMKKLPFVPLIGSGRYQFQLVAVDVTADIVAKSLEMSTSDGKIYDVVGPETLSLKDITVRLGTKAQINKLMIHIPVWFLKTFPTPITKDQVIMIEQGSVGDGSAMTADFHPPTISFDAKGEYPLY